MKNIKYIFLVLMLFSFMGCSYNVQNILLIDKNENIKNFITIWTNSDYESYSKDIKNQLELFLNIDDYKLNPDNSSLEIELKEKKPLNYFKYIKKEENNGITTLKIKIPPIITYKIYDGSFSGPNLHLQVSLAKEFEIIDANSFEIENYESVFDKKEYTKVVWNIPTDVLAKGVELSVRYKLKK